MKLQFEVATVSTDLVLKCYQYGMNLRLESLLKSFFANAFFEAVTGRPGVLNSWASGATLHVGNRAEGCMMFFDFEITTSSSNSLCNVARSKVDLQKNKIITSPASPQSSSVARSEIH